MDECPFNDSPIRHPDLIVPRLYLGDLHVAQDPAVATFLGITHIISVLDFHPTFPKEMKHVRKMHVMMSDSFREKITPYLDDTTEFIREALESNPENKVLVRPTILQVRASEGGGAKSVRWTLTGLRFIASWASAEAPPSFVRTSSLSRV